MCSVNQQQLLKQRLFTSVYMLQRKTRVSVRMCVTHPNVFSPNVRNTDSRKANYQQQEKDFVGHLSCFCFFFFCLCRAVGVSSCCFVNELAQTHRSVIYAHTHELWHHVSTNIINYLRRFLILDKKRAVITGNPLFTLLKSTLLQNKLWPLV